MRWQEIAVMVCLICSASGIVCAQHSAGVALRVSVQVISTSTVTIQFPNTESSTRNSADAENKRSLEVSCPSRGVFTISIGAEPSDANQHYVRCDLPNTTYRFNPNTDSRPSEKSNFTPLTITY